MDRQPVIRSIGLVGSLALLVGAYLPWVATNPSYRSVILIGYLGMGWGIADGVKLAVLCCGCLALVLTAFGYWKRLGRLPSVVLVASGAVPVLLSLGVGLDHGFTGPFLAWFGALVSGIGGGLVLIVGVSAARNASPFRSDPDRPPVS
jgi:hypothetical protein